MNQLMVNRMKSDHRINEIRCDSDEEEDNMYRSMA